MAIVILNEGNVILSEATAILNLFQDLSLVNKIPNQVPNDILKNTPHALRRRVAGGEVDVSS